ncbi:MAG: restriction endonuclease subunit S [Spirochaetes bacterium]|nr:restriction endonuclease subunit S [Spirochaetota bacterium]
MSAWKECKLAAIAEIVMGQSPKGESCNQIGNGFPLLNGPTEFGIKYPQAIQYTIEPTRISKVGDILFCVRGSTTGKMNWSDKEYVIGRGLAAIRHRDGNDLQSFVKGIIDFNLSTLLARATGSTFPNIAREQLESLDIYLPPLPEQRAIASVLSSLDDKIDLLHRQNKTLEAMAETLFRQWFVEEADEGWEEKPLSEIISVKHGYAFKGGEISDQKNSNILVTPGNFKIGGGFKGEKYKYFVGESFPDEYRFIANDLVVTMTDLSVDTDTLGYPAFIPQSKEFIYLHNQRVGKVNFQDDHIEWKYFVYFTLRTDEYRQYIIGSASGTSIMHTSPDRICAYICHFPTKNIIEEFNTILEPIYSKISYNTMNIQLLISLRDTLLPKLMSGEVRVEI